MKYFDIDTLDSQTIERVETTLNSMDNLSHDYSILKEYRQFYSDAEEELLDYYYNRLEREALTKKSTTLQEADLPF